LSFKLEENFSVKLITMSNKSVFFLIQFYKFIKTNYEIDGHDIGSISIKMYTKQVYGNLKYLQWI